MIPGQYPRCRFEDPAMERAFTRSALIREVHRAGVSFRQGSSARPLALALAALEQVDPDAAAELAKRYRAGPWPGAEIRLRCLYGSGWVV